MTSSIARREIDRHSNLRLVGKISTTPNHSERWKQWAAEADSESNDYNEDLA